MAYMQAPGRGPVVNKAVEYLTDNDKKKKKDKKTVKKYDVSTGKASEISVSKGSASDKSAKDFGNVVDFGKSVSQKKSSTTGKLKEGTNTNVMASASTYGKLPKGFKGRAFDKSNKIVDFSNSNQDERRGEKFRVYK
jgi:hypothetical protein